MSDIELIANNNKSEYSSIDSKNQLFSTFKGTIIGE